MSSSSSAILEASIVPVTVMYRNIPNDLTLSSSLPLAEVLPAVAARLDALDAESAAYGMHLVTEDGRALKDSLSLADQHVGAGAVLLLELRSTEAEARYDDLVEAVAVAVEKQQAPWSPENSASLSVAAACLLFLVVGVLLERRGPGGVLAPGCAAGCALVLILAAYTLGRLHGKGTWPLVMTASALAGVSAHTAFAGPATGVRLAAAGLAVAATSLLCLPLMREERWLLAGPLLTATCMATTGVGTDTLDLPLTHVLAVVVAGMSVLSLVAPWLALASIPVEITLPERTEAPEIPPGSHVTPALTARVMSTHGLVLSVRVAASLVTLACVPTLTGAGTAGPALVTAVAIASLLGTRAARSQADVAAGMVGGMLLMVALLITILLGRPDLLLPAVAIVGGVGVAVLLLNVLGPAYRPRLARAADAIEVIILMTIMPLAAVVCGVL